MYRLETKVIQTSDECVSFAEQDLFDIVRNQLRIPTNIMVIDRFEIVEEQRSKGFGSEFLKQFCEDNKEKYFLLLIAGMPLEEARDPTKEEIAQKLSKLEKFYTSIGFVNVNETIGQYEQKISFLYKGGAGETILLNLVN